MTKLEAARRPAPAIDNRIDDDGFLHYTVYSSEHYGRMENPVDFTNVRHARKYATDQWFAGLSVTVIYVYND